MNEFYEFGIEDGYNNNIKPEEEVNVMKTVLKS